MVYIFVVAACTAVKVASFVVKIFVLQSENHEYFAPQKFPTLQTVTCTTNVFPVMIMNHTLIF